jgi:hypothetical protein
VAKNNQLQDIQVKQSKPTEKTYYLFDGLGLYLEITPNNCKNWKFRYTYCWDAKNLASARIHTWPPDA